MVAVGAGQHAGEKREKKHGAQHAGAAKLLLVCGCGARARVI